jgi:hypothetical protein
MSQVPDIDYSPGINRLKISGYGRRALNTFGDSICIAFSRQGDLISRGAESIGNAGKPINNQQVTSVFGTTFLSFDWPCSRGGLLSSRYRLTAALILNLRFSA